MAKTDAEQAAASTDPVVPFAAAYVGDAGATPYDRPRRGQLMLIALLGLAIGFGAGWVWTLDRGPKAVQNIVAMSWGDGKYGKAFYGAEIYLVPVGQKFSVRGRVWIGRGNSYFQDLGELELVNNPEDAVANWGQITWSPSNLTIGPGNPSPVTLPMAKLESHR